MRFERTPQEAQTGRGVRVLEADPELAGGLEGVRLARATDRLTARPVGRPVGHPLRVEPTRFAVLGSRFAVEMSAYRR